MQKKKSYQDLVLNEAKKDSIVLAWGRFNPPTIGHEKLINAVVAEARKRGADYRIYPTKSEDPKKNPLTFKEKVRFMRKIFPRHARKISSDEGINTLIKAAKKLESEGYKNITLLAGSDRIDEFKILLNKYNKKEYTFDSIDVVSAGKRDPDAEGVSGMSASKMRAAASAGDFASFSKGVPNKKIAKPLYNAVRKGMKINEQFDKDGVFEYVELLNEETTGVVGSRFSRLLRFGLATGGTGDIPLTKRAFKDFEAAETNPILRKKVFSTVDRIFEYLLNDDILYNRFLLLLHRKYIFGEGKEDMHFHDLKKNLKEADQTTPLSTAPNHPEKMNFVARFPSPEYTNSFIKDMVLLNLLDVNWKSGDGTEIQFYVRKSTSGQEAPSSSEDELLRRVDRQNRYAGQNTAQFGSEARIVDIVMKHGGKISRFDGDVREGLEEDGELLEGLLNKSWKSEIAYDILSEVYLRGLNSWEDDCSKKDTTTPDQWAYARINSFIGGGKAQKEHDADLWEEHLQREDEPLSEIDEAFLAELGKLGKAAVAGVAFYAWRKHKKKKKETDQQQTSKKSENQSKKSGWRSEVDWDKNEEYNIDEEFEAEVYSIDERFEAEVYDVDEEFEMFTAEDHGAGFEGTNKLRKKYSKVTPGQTMRPQNPESKVIIVPTIPRRKKRPYRGRGGNVAPYGFGTKKEEVEENIDEASKKGFVLSRRVKSKDPTSRDGDFYTNTYDISTVYKTEAEAKKAAKKKGKTWKAVSRANFFKEEVEKNVDEGSKITAHKSSSPRRYNKKTKTVDYRADSAAKKKAAANWIKLYRKTKKAQQDRVQPFLHDPEGEWGEEVEMNVDEVVKSVDPGALAARKARQVGTPHPTIRAVGGAAHPTTRAVGGEVSRDRKLGTGKKTPTSQINKMRRLQTKSIIQTKQKLNNSEEVDVLKMKTKKEKRTTANVGGKGTWGKTWNREGTKKIPVWIPDKEKRAEREEVEIDEAATRAEKAEYKNLMNKYGSKPITKIPWKTWRRIEDLGVKVRGDEDLPPVGGTVGDMLKKIGKLKEGRMSKRQAFLVKKATEHLKKTDPQSLEPGHREIHKEPTKRHVGIIRDREKAKKEKENTKTEDTADAIRGERDQHRQDVLHNRREHRKSLRDIRQKGRETNQEKRRDALDVRKAAIKKQQKTLNAEFVLEKSPPSDKAERFIKKNKESFQDKYGEQWKEVLYSTAWKMHNKHWA